MAILNNLKNENKLYNYIFLVSQIKHFLNLNWYINYFTELIFMKYIF